MTKTRREFKPEFKREAVALLESAGRPQMRIATEPGGSPSMLRNWRAIARGASLRSRAAPGSACRHRGSTISGRSAGGDRTIAAPTRSYPNGMGYLKKSLASSRRCRIEVWLDRATCPHLPGAAHVPRARGRGQWVLCLAVSAGEPKGGGEPAPAAGGAAAP
jgi:transposase-like protein